MASKIRYSAGIVAWLSMDWLVRGSDIVDPYVPPDVGVSVTMSELRLLMLGGAGRLEWDRSRVPIFGNCATAA